MQLLLDTCALIWVVLAPEKLSAGARSTLASQEHQVLYSPISCAEVSWAVERRRLALDRHWKLWFRHQVELNGWTEVPIDLEVVEEAYSLPEPFHRDPVDRLLVATARLHALHVVTADEKILAYPHVRTIW